MINHVNSWTTKSKLIKKRTQEIAPSGKKITKVRGQLNQAHYKKNPRNGRIREKITKYYIEEN